MTDATPSSAPLPKTFGEYLRSFGPGLVVVLTWLGAGDIVEMATAGADFGYSLMWVLVIAVAMRWVMVSVIARYQLCNPRGEHLIDGLCRLHRAYAPLLLASAVVMGHFYGSYMTRGIGEAFVNMTGFGTIWGWAIFWTAIALVLVFQPTFQRIETLFKLFLVLLSVAFIGTAVWVGFDPLGIARGMVSLEMPEQRGNFGPLLVATGMIGAVGGSLMNLVYPYFLDDKGWRGPEYRRVQHYDFLLAMVAMLLIDLAIWTLGAETLHKDGGTVKTMDDLPWLLRTGTTLGRAGELLFYSGIFAAVFTSLVGHALGLGCLASHACRHIQSRGGRVRTEDLRRTRIYKGVAAWCLVSPLVWTIPGMPDFITLTLVVNAMQVLLLPLIAGGLWLLSSRPADIGPEYCNRWWEHVVLAVLLSLSVVGAWGAITATNTTIREWNATGPTRSQREAVEAISEATPCYLARDSEGHVEHLDFLSRPVSQKVLTRLRELDHLQVLDLSRTGISDADLRYLRGLSRLKYLQLHGLSLSPAAVARLQRRIPQCKITTAPAQGLQPPPE